MVAFPRLPELDELPPLPPLDDLPSFESLEDEDCEPCGAIKDELKIRCERITTKPDAVQMCVTDLGKVVSEARKGGTPDAMRDQMYEVFLKYREKPPEVSEAVSPAPEPEAELSLTTPA